MTYKPWILALAFALAAAPTPARARRADAPVTETVRPRESRPTKVEPSEDASTKRASKDARASAKPATRASGARATKPVGESVKGEPVASKTAKAVEAALDLGKSSESTKKSSKNEDATTKVGKAEDTTKVGKREGATAKVGNTEGTTKAGKTEPATKKAAAADDAPARDGQAEDSSGKAKVAAKTKGKSKREAKEKPPCFAPEVHVVRKRGTELEHRQLALTFCDGTPNPSALDSLSVLARPRDVERPFLPEIKAYQRRPVDRGPASKRRDPAYLSEQVMRVHPGLLERLQKIANRFRGKTIEVISGHRPDARDTSRHHHGRALDIHVEGVSREALRDFARTLENTGVGYYPNGYFVHVDVRDDKGYWVDRSGPGEPADYGPWPPREQEIERTRNRVIDRALAELSGLREPIGRDEAPREEKVVVSDAPKAAPSEERDEPAHGEDELTREEIERIRREAMQALSALESD